jgi:molybdenum cofactor biosynthesis protein B
MSHESHRAEAPAFVRCYVVTISDTRTIDTDSSGRAIADLLGEAGHAVAGRAIVKDDRAAIRAILVDALGREDTQAVITTGGTGISSRDNTFEVVNGLFEKRLDGFGELFRMLSYQEIGSAAMLSRACAGAARGKLLAALPGSEPAVRLAMTKLLLPEIGHLVREVTR